MKLFKLIFEIRYPSAKPEIFKYREKIISTLSKDAEPNMPDMTEGFEFLIKQKNAKAVVQNNRMGVDMLLLEDYPNRTRYARDNILKIIKSINSELRVNLIDRIGVRSLWLKELDIPFEELVAHYKQQFYKDNEILGISKDVAVSFTLYDDGNRINYQSGPLGFEEYQNVIKMNLQNYQISSNPVPTDKTAILVDFDYFSDEKLKYNDNFAISFVDKALGKATETISKTINILNL